MFYVKMKMSLIKNNLKYCQTKYKNTKQKLIVIAEDDKPMAHEEEEEVGLQVAQLGLRH